MLNAKTIRKCETSSREQLAQNYVHENEPRLQNSVGSYIENIALC